jgi:glycine/D-amino acid oxidase-like deaminating enzyme
LLIYSFHRFLPNAFFARLLHPLSPRGKFVHWGLEGLASGSRLVRSASRWTPQCILRDRLYRVALTEDNVDTLKALQTHDKMVATNGMFRWIERDEVEALLGCPHSLGGLELSQGCCVLHVPSYLDGLYKACQQMGSIQWKITTDPIPPEELASYSAFIFAAGAGMLQKGILDQSSFPVDIVRGQSLVLKSEGSPLLSEALLCGKYISPMLDSDDAILVGASHEFGSNPMSQDLLYQELKEKSYNLAPQLWENSYVEKVTCGYRVQSKRGNLGRTPIVGHLKDNQWIFTGLSSRGLLYHGIYAEKLSDMILSSDNGKSVRDTHPYLDWWRNR